VNSKCACDEERVKGNWKSVNDGRDGGTLNEICKCEWEVKSELHGKV
jgi:hypothetical protein